MSRLWASDFDTTWDRTRNARRIIMALAILVVLIAALVAGFRLALEPHEVTHLLFAAGPGEEGAAARLRALGDILLAASAAALVLAALLARELFRQQRAEKRFEAAMDAASSGILIVDRDGAIRFANAEAQQLFGYSREEFLGIAVEDLVPESVRTGHAAMRGRFCAAPTRRAMGAGADLTALRKDGASFAAEIGLSPISFGDSVATLAVIADISERKRVEEALRRSNAELEQFAYIASHDLQEPLRMVSSYTQLLAERYSATLDERGHRYVGYAVDGAQRMQGLVRDLLSYSRVSAPQLKQKPLSIAVLVDETVTLMSEVIAKAGAEIEVRSAPDIYADENQVRRVLQNLVANALKFRADAAPVIRISGERRGVMVVITVEDNGIGIAPKNCERVFQMFQRLHERGRYEGSGIGLAIVKKIIEGHGGQVWIESELDKGAKVRFTLPMASAAHETVEATCYRGQ